MSPKNSTVIKGWFFFGLLSACLQALAGPAVGTVTDLSGPLLARKSDGTVKILSTKSTVESGDMLVSEKDTYARIRFVDNSEVTLRPNTQFKIENFSYAEDKPQNDSSVFSLLKGGLRAVTGALGKRSREKVGVNTPAATIGIRGTTFIAEYIPSEESPTAAFGRMSLASADLTLQLGSQGIVSDVPLVPVMPSFQLAQNAPSPSTRLAPGLYVNVLDGMIQVRNTGGSLNFSAGQFGYTPSLLRPPIILPSNPGIQFAPPPAFSSSTGSAANELTPDQNNNVDCEVR